MSWVFAEPFEEDSFDESQDQLRDAVTTLRRAHERLARVDKAIEYAKEERAEALRAMADAHGAMEEARAQLLDALPKLTLTELEQAGVQAGSSSAASQERHACRCSPDNQCPAYAGAHRESAERARRRAQGAGESRVSYAEDSGGGWRCTSAAGQRPRGVA